VREGSGAEKGAAAFVPRTPEVQDRDRHYGYGASINSAGGRPDLRATTSIPFHLTGLNGAIADSHPDLRPHPTGYSSGLEVDYLQVHIASVAVRSRVRRPFVDSLG
jgi:hypothetical protein